VSQSSLKPLDCLERSAVLLLGGDHESLNRSVAMMLGRRVLSLLEAYASRVAFLTPELAFASAGAIR